MYRFVAALITLGLAAACNRPAAPKTINAQTPEGRLEQLVASNATIVGYLYTAEKPFVIASFRDGALQWRHDPDSKAMIQGPAELYRQTAAMPAMLPWLVAHLEEARREMGEDWWPYGLEPNRHVLDTFLRYHYEQGLSKRRLQPEELFAPETLEAFKV